MNVHNASCNRPWWQVCMLTRHFMSTFRLLLWSTETNEVKNKVMPAPLSIRRDSKQNQNNIACSPAFSNEHLYLISKEAIHLENRNCLQSCLTTTSMCKNTHGAISRALCTSQTTKHRKSCVCVSTEEKFLEALKLKFVSNAGENGILVKRISSYLVVLSKTSHWSIPTGFIWAMTFSSGECQTFVGVHSRHCCLEARATIKTFQFIPSI